MAWGVALSQEPSHPQHPLADELHALRVDERAPQLRHHHPWIVRFHPVHQDGALGLARDDVEGQILARVSARGDGRLAPAERVRILLLHRQGQRRARRGPSPVMAVRAVRVQVRSGALLQRPRVRLVPHRAPRHRPRLRRTLQVAHARQPRELVLGSLVIGIVPVEVPRLEPDGCQALGALVAALALVHVGDHVVDEELVPRGVRHLHRAAAAHHLQRGVRALLVPHVGQRHPASPGMHQDPRLHQPEALVRIARRPPRALRRHAAIGRVHERLGEDRAHREIERLRLL